MFVQSLMSKGFPDYCVLHGVQEAEGSNPFTQTSENAPEM